MVNRTIFVCLGLAWMLSMVGLYLALEHDTEKQRITTPEEYVEAWDNCVIYYVKKDAFKTLVNAGHTDIITRFCNREVRKKYYVTQSAEVPSKSNGDQK
jgi:hypothetical protein